MNEVVYVCTGRVRGVVSRGYGQLHQVPRNWESEKRVTPEAHEAALAGLREHYRRKALLVGMSLEGYCQRFGVKL